MALPSRSSASSTQAPVVLTNPTNGTVSSGQSQSSGSSSSFGGIENPQALEALSILISQLQRGETPGQKQQGERNNEITRTRELSRDYSKGAAFLDAENAVNQALRKSMEANMPAITKAIQGAGTSSSSMQGLLAQRLATESAQAAGALGAKQAVDYGNISANLQGVLEALTRTNDPGTEALLKAIGLLKVDRSTSSQQSTQSQSSSGGGGGGTYIANTGSSGSYSSSGDNQVFRLEGTGNAASYSSGNSGSYYGGGWGDYTGSSGYTGAGSYDSSWMDTGYDLGSGYSSYGGGSYDGNWVDTGYDLGSGYSDYGYSDYGSFF